MLALEYTPANLSEIERTLSADWLRPYRIRVDSLVCRELYDLRGKYLRLRGVKWRMRKSRSQNHGNRNED